MHGQYRTSPKLTYHTTRSTDRLQTLDAMIHQVGNTAEPAHAAATLATGRAHNNPDARTPSVLPASHSPTCLATSPRFLRRPWSIPAPHPTTPQNTRLRRCSSACLGACNSPASTPMTDRHAGWCRVCDARQAAAHTGVSLETHPYAKHITSAQVTVSQRSVYSVKRAAGKTSTQNRPKPTIPW